MNIKHMTQKDIKALPSRKWDEEIECNSIIILPGKKSDMHESGFRKMDFVAVRNNEAICLLSGCSDVIHIDGIGGYGYKWDERFGRVPNLVSPTGWSIDCLPETGLLRMWPRSGKIIVGPALSSFEIYALEKDPILQNSLVTS